jgi:predicted transcriptional regulator
MEIYNYNEFWRYTGKEPVAFILSIPEPKKFNDINKDELTEIVTKIWKRGFLEENDRKYKISKYGYHLIEYYKKILEINFISYNPGYFEKQIGSNGKNMN